MNRFDRITAILISLQSRRVVTAQQLAERFETSIRTIYRDIRTLEEAGVPIWSEAGVGYSIMDGYRLPPVMFTPQEALSFVASEKLMEKFTDKALGGHYQSAMDKIRAVLKNSEKDLLSKLENQIQINPQHSAINDSLPETLDVLLRSITENKIVKIKYQSFLSDETTERDIEPVGVFHENQFWYVIGYCHKRRDYRQFRADRMQDIQLTAIPQTRKHQDLNEYRKNEKNPGKKTRIVIEVDRSVSRYMQSGKHFYGFESEKNKGEKIEMVFLSEDMGEGFARWFLMFGDRAQIIEPESLKTRVRELLENIQKRI